ncbi:MAG: class I SAM-dependent methyltransferase [Oscillospiraceae bacterium]|nr:class I SAM-dependent methyltransferase [Oscillospiraceae bacterium]
MAYKEFSYYYDYFNYSADYDFVFSKIDELVRKHHTGGRILCDLGCGTGELAMRFDEAGYDVIAVDNSDEMLDVFHDKLDEDPHGDILVLKQDITELDMYGTVDVFTCTFDTVNHLEGREKVQKLFDKVSLFMHPEGIFIFDMNTRYKHEHVLMDQTFDFDDEEARCIWKNELDRDNRRTRINIEIDDKVSGERYEESFYEYYYTLDEILDMLKASGLSVIELLDGERYTQVTDSSERYLFAVKKEK